MNTKFIITRNAGILAATALGAFAVSGSMASPADKPSDADNFYKSGRVSQQEVKFNNQYRMKVAGNLFLPKDMDKEARCPAIIVGHPMGAVKEQSANLYAAKMAERGFVTLALDLPFWGGSDGEPRNSVSPDMYAEAFSAAADYLGTRPFVDRDRIGVIGICGSGSFAISAAKIDPRLKAIATVSMYDMGAASRNGLRNSQTPGQRKKILAEAAEDPSSIPAGLCMNFAKIPVPLSGSFLSSTALPAASLLRRDSRRSLPRIRRLPAT